MAKEKSIVSRIISVAVFILLEIASLFILTHNSEFQTLWLVRLSHGFKAKVWGATQNVNDYFSLRKQNDELALENEALLEKVKDLEAAAYAADPNFKPYEMDNGFRYTPATIIKSSSNSQHNYLILDKGSDDGIVPNSGIITGKGVVGIVNAVSKHYSYAISFLNGEMNISSRLGNSGAVGPLAWDGQKTDGALLKEIPLQFKYNPGDTVFTSGYSVIFPPDIPLGVAGDATIINGATNEIKVTLFQDQSALKYVIVVQNLRAQEIEALEKENDKAKKEEEEKKNEEKK